MNRQCIFIREDGSRCKAHAMSESDYCFMHDSDNAEERLEAVRKGGRQRKKPLDLEEIKISTFDDLLPFTNKCINEIRSGLLPPKTANSIAYMLNITIELLNKAEIIRRLERIENVISVRTKTEQKNTREIGARRIV